MNKSWTISQVNITGYANTLGAAEYVIDITHHNINYEDIKKIKIKSNKIIEMQLRVMVYFSLRANYTSLLSTHVFIR